LPRRLLQLLVGLTLFGVSMSLMIRSGTGMLPWDVLHYGVASHLPLSIGTVIILTGVAVLLMWIPQFFLPFFTIELKVDDRTTVMTSH
jgi:uncharacterized membrane protein YczE